VKEKTENTELTSEKTEEKSEMTVKLKIEGMMCPHCEARVKKCLLEQAGVVSAEVSHKSGEAVLVCDEAFNVEAAVAAVTEAGYPAAAE
jgi:Cu2+-exporting ATPase